MAASWRGILHQNRWSSGGGCAEWKNERFCSTPILEEVHYGDVNLNFAMGCIQVSVANLSYEVRGHRCIGYNPEPGIP